MMTALRLSPKMILALELLYETSGQVNFVPYSTALALGARALVFMPKNPHQVTGAGEFPRYSVTLTNAGRSWCERHFAKLRSVEILKSGGFK